jgi:excisionase family DNA binding protein
VSEDLLTVQELAHRLKVPASWVYQHTRARGRQRLPSIKMGKYLRFEWSAVQAWLGHRRREYEILPGEGLNER